LLEQSRIISSQREFGAYLNILPKTLKQFPVFFSDQEVEYLEGSPLKLEIEVVKEDFLDKYDSLCKEVYSFS
jgi:transposase